MGVLRSARAFLSAKPPAEVRSYAVFAAAGPVILGLLVAGAVVVLRADLPDPLQTGYSRPGRGRDTESGLVDYAVSAVLFGAALSLFAWTMLVNFCSVMGLRSARTAVPVAAFLAWGIGSSLTCDAAVNLIVNLEPTAAVPGLLMAFNGWPVTAAGGLLAALITWIGVRRAAPD